MIMIMMRIAYFFILKLTDICVYNNLTMKKVKSTGRVGRSSFFDRIKMGPKQDVNMKQNIDINHIHQSGYKLTRSKSHRKGHSLERKIPIISTQTTESHQEQRVSESRVEGNVTPLQFTVKMNQYLNKKENGSASQSRKGSLRQSFRELFNILQVGKKKQAISEHFQSKNDMPIGLEEEQQILELIKTMWQALIKLKTMNHFPEQIFAIEQLLKTIVLKLAKPKLQILEEHSKLSLKAPSIKYSSPGNIVSIRDEPKESSLNVDYNSYSRLECDAPPLMLKTEEVSGQEIQFRKIMYILEQNHKMSCKEKQKSIDKRQTLESDSRSVIQKSRNEKEGKATKYFKEETTQPMLRNSHSQSYFSSFTNSQTTRNKDKVIFEQDKVGSQDGSDRLFLKNIVKKAKNKQNQPIKDPRREKMKTQAPMNHNNTFESVSFTSSIQMSKTPEPSQHYISSITSEPIQQSKESEEYSLSNCQEPPQQQIKSLQSYDISCSVTPQTSQQQSQSESPYLSTIEQVSSLQTGSESKRATLNNIINMLNSKYNKKIAYKHPK